MSANSAYAGMATGGGSDRSAFRDLCGLMCAEDLCGLARRGLMAAGRARRAGATLSALAARPPCFILGFFCGLEKCEECK